MRFSLIVLLVVMLLSLSAEWLLNPLREAGNSPDPAKIIDSLASANPELQQALNEADQGSITDLVIWVNRATPLERQQLAYLHLRQIVLADGDEKISSLADDRMIYELRNRLRAFVNVPTGEPKLDLELANTLAYGLVGGSTNPTKQDKDLAYSLVPRIETANARKPNHALTDTIGCVYFAVGDFKRAKQEFATALQLSQADDAGTPEDKARGERLYRSRMQAAEHNARVAGEGVGESLPLPLSPASSEKHPAAALNGKSP